MGTADLVGDQIGLDRTDNRVGYTGCDYIKTQRQRRLEIDKNSLWQYFSCLAVPYGVLSSFGIKH